MAAEIASILELVRLLQRKRIRIWAESEGEIGKAADTRIEVIVRTAEAFIRERADAPETAPVKPRTVVPYGM